MSFYLIGIDYKKISLRQREALCRKQAEIRRYWQRHNPEASTVLITCNRIELCAFSETRQKPEIFTATFKEEFSPLFKDAYTFFGKEEISGHGLRLGCGLRSQLKGEAEILKQLELWHKKSDMAPELYNLWALIIAESREIRKASGLDRNSVDISDILFEDLKRQIPFNRKIKIMIIGTGKVAQLITENRRYRVDLLFVARKRRKEAEKFARSTGSKIILPFEIPGYIGGIDVIISATSSPHYILKLSHFAGMEKRRERLIYVYDLAVPRDVAPDIGKIGLVNLKNIDQLMSSFSYTDSSRLKQSLLLAERLIRKRIKEYGVVKDEKEDTHRHAA